MYFCYTFCLSFSFSIFLIFYQVEKILDPAWATLLQCEQTTRHGVIAIFLRAILIGLENVITRKFAPRTLTHPIAVQIVTDLDYIRAWAAQAEETLRTIERDEPPVTNDDVTTDSGEGELGRRPSHPLQGSFKEPLAFMMTKLNSSSSFKDAPLSSSLISSGSNKQPKEATPRKANKHKLLPSRDLQRWTCISQILTTCTNSERVITNEEMENLPIPDAAKWLALCKR